MKMIMTGLVELAEENQKMLGHIILMSMYANSFKVDGVSIEFGEDDATG